MILVISDIVKDGWPLCAVLSCLVRVQECFFLVFMLLFCWRRAFISRSAKPSPYVCCSFIFSLGFDAQSCAHLPPACIVYIQDVDSSSASTTASSSMSTQSGSLSAHNGDKPEESERNTRRHTRHTPRSSRIARPNGSCALVGPNSGRNSGKLPSRGHRVVLGGGGGGGPRVTAEHKNGRPDLGVAAAACSTSSGGDDRDQGAVNADALNAALLAVQADATVSRPALNRMLNARQRRPLREDSNPSSREGGGSKVLVDGSKALVDSTSGRSLKGSSPAVPEAEERHRRSMTMDDRWVSSRDRSSYFRPRGLLAVVVAGVALTAVWA